MTALTMLLYGAPGVGKTPTALTVPGPTLLLDAEGGSEFVPGRRVVWDPRRAAPPAAGGWDLCVVHVRDWQTVVDAVAYLRAGKHEFASVVLDSVTALQARCRRALIADSRTGRSTEQIWGFLLDDMEDVLRDLIDTKSHPDAPVQCVVLTAHATVSQAGRVEPDVQGGLRRKVPGMVDVVGYLSAGDEPSADPAARQLLIAPTEGFVAKDRTSVREDGGITRKFGELVAGPLNLQEIQQTLSSQE